MRSAWWCRVGESEEGENETTYNWRKWRWLVNRTLKNNLHEIAMRYILQLGTVCRLWHYLLSQCFTISSGLEPNQPSIYYIIMNEWGKNGTKCKHLILMLAAAVELYLWNWIQMVRHMFEPCQWIYRPLFSSIVSSIPYDRLVLSILMQANIQYFSCMFRNYFIAFKLLLFRTLHNKWE